MKNVLVAGSTGLVGRELVGVLLENRYYSHVVLPQRTAFQFNHLAVKEIHIDYDNLQGFNPGLAIHDVYICLGTTQKKAEGREGFFKVDYTYVVELARWAKRQGAEKICVISSIGANPQSRFSFYLRTKGMMESELKGMGFNHTIIMRPSLLIGKRQERRPVEEFAMWADRHFRFLYIGVANNYRGVEASLVAKAMFHFTVNVTETVKVVENKEILSLGSNHAK